MRTTAEALEAFQENLPPELSEEFYSWYEDPEYVGGSCQRCGATVGEYYEPVRRIHNLHHELLSIRIFVMSRGITEIIGGVKSMVDALNEELGEEDASGTPSE